MVCWMCMTVIWIEQTGIIKGGATENTAFAPTQGIDNPLRIDQLA